jgi:porin
MFTVRLRPVRTALLAGLFALSAAPPAAFAQDAAKSPPPNDDLWTRDKLTGDWAGRRTYLANQGLTFDFNYVGEGFADVSGGQRRLAIYEGRFEMTFEANLEKLFHWPGATFHVTGYQIHGRGLSSNAVGNLLTVSNIEAASSSRLFTLWLEQNWGDDKFSLRIGQLAADDEFATSDTAGLFINGTFGWPGSLGINLISGGPAYPLATPGVRLRIGPFNGLSFQAAVFSGDPGGRGSEEDPQLRNPSGTAFSFTGGAFFIGEATLASPDAGWIPGLPTKLKAGFWYHTGDYDDQRFDDTGRSLADPASSGVALRHRGDYGGYLILDQALWRVPGSTDRGLNGFVRFAINPSDRNLVSWYLDAGLVFTGPLAVRPKDSIGVAFGFARISGAARGYDRDAIALAAATDPVRDYEGVLELTYQAQITPWWTVQPDLQYVFHPGGNVTNPLDASGGRIRDALVLGVRTTFAF